MMGVQGAGKGTQAVHLQETYGIPHVSTGDLFRAMKQQDTPLAREVQDVMNSGQLVSDELTNRIVDERLSQPDAQQGAILDGYPRNIEQAKALDDMLAARGETVTVVIVMDLDRDIAIKRVEGRRYSQDKSRVYNIYFNPPQQEGVDDVDGQPLIQRDDDHREAVEQRINTYFEKTMPLIDYYDKKGLVQHIDATGDIEAVRERVVAAIETARA